MTLDKKTTAAGIVGAVSAVVQFIASVPPELQNSVPMLFPEQSRAYVAGVANFIFAFCIFYVGRSVTK